MGVAILGGYGVTSEISQSDGKTDENRDRLEKGDKL